MARQEATRVLGLDLGANSVGWAGGKRVEKRKADRSLPHLVVDNLVNG